MRAPTPLLFLPLSRLLWPRRLVCLSLLTPLLLQAQGLAAADAANPEAATVPLVHHSLAPQPPLAEASPSIQSWSDGHKAVAAFPRGHADIVAWEARQGAQAASPANATSPHAPADHGKHKSSHSSKPKNHSHHPDQGGKP